MLPDHSAQMENAAIEVSVERLAVEHEGIDRLQIEMGPDRGRLDLLQPALEVGPPDPTRHGLIGRRETGRGLRLRGGDGA